MHLVVLDTLDCLVVNGLNENKRQHQNIAVLEEVEVRSKYLANMCILFNTTLDFKENLLCVCFFSFEGKAVFTSCTMG